MEMRPILFNSTMVRAILEGRKTVTRRVVKPQPEKKPMPIPDEKYWLGCFDGDDVCRLMNPPCCPGSVLYVRETWAIFPVIEAGSVVAGTRRFYYKADEDNRTDGWTFKWRPSIHMPREAARIFLRVTDVRAERLQDITEEGAFAEGAQTTATFQSARYVFRDIWDSTIKPADRVHYGWEANPWVWVISFERCGKPKGE